MTRFSEVAKRLFAVRSFKGQDPAVIRERFRLVQGLVRDVLAGRLSESTAKRLSREVSDRLLAGLVPVDIGKGGRRRLGKALLALFGRDHGMFRQELASRQFGRLRRF